MQELSTPLPAAQPAPRALGALYLGLSFLGAFLMFTAELAVARRIQPDFGSSASVWTTSLMFFQLLLFLGYLGAGSWPRLGGARAELFHLVVVLLPLASFPFRFALVDGPGWLAVMVALATSVAPSFLVLSTTSVLSQRWFSESRHQARLDPYFLFGVSNAGSLIGLLVYPLLIEPFLGMETQLTLWYGLYAVFAALHFAARPRQPQPVPPATDAASEGKAARPAGWLLFSGAGAAMLSAVTNVVTADASIPLLWALPLAVYLLTFVICFAKRTPSWTAVSRLSLAALVLGGVAFAVGRSVNVLFQPSLIVLHTVVLFVACLLAHWNLVQARPASAAKLGGYYLSLSLGGWAGTTLIAIVVPIVFAKIAITYLDYAVAGAVLIGAALYRDRAQLAHVWRHRRVRALLVGAGALGFVGLIAAATALAMHARVYGVRTFYGFHQVKDEDGFRWLHHGTTVHGIEDLAHPGEPRGYYHSRSPIGGLLRSRHAGTTIGVVGLGAGGLAGWSREGQEWDFFELDPEVVHIAETYFTFLSGMPAKHRTITGDARLTIASIEPGRYDTLVLDAFSSDFVPTHLMTREALEIYRTKVKPEGRIVFQVSNRVFDLIPVVAALAESVGLAAVWNGDVEPNEAELAEGRFASLWCVVGTEQALEPLVEELGWRRVVAPPGARPWTDDYVNVLGALRL